MSPAVCGRGLKPKEYIVPSMVCYVARRVRAWIETVSADWLARQV